MKFENLVSHMMTMNNLGRLWHWATDSAQQHVVYEKFLSENEALTDSFVESTLGNSIELNMKGISVRGSIESGFDTQKTRDEITSYRQTIREFQKELDEGGENFAPELISILDDVNELCSKTLYLLKLK